MGIALPSAKAVKVELAEDPVLQNDLNQLTEEEKRQFNQLKKSGIFSEYELHEILKEKIYYSSTSTMIQLSGVSSTVIRKAASLLAKIMGQKSIAEISDFLFGWQDDLEAGIAAYLLRNGWNRDVANWTAKSIMFIIF